MIALIVILIAIAVFASLLFIPVRVRLYAKYANSSFVNDYRIKYGFLNIKKKKKKSSEKSEPPDKKEKTSPLALIRFIKENMELVKKLVSDTTDYLTQKAVRFEKFSISATLGTDDAMDTALIFGGTSAFLYNTIGFLERRVRLKNINIDFKPDFTEPKIFIEFESIIKTKIYNVIGLAFVAIKRGLPLWKKRGEINNGKSD